MNIENIGIVGSLTLGLAGFLFGVYQYHDNKKRRKIKLKVRVTNGVLTFTSGDLSEPMIFLDIANVGEKAVIINSPNINVKRKGGGSLFTHFGYYKPFPQELKPGENIVAWHEIKPLAKALKNAGMSGKVPLEGYFISQVGDKYKAKPYKLDVDDWSKG